MRICLFTFYFKPDLCAGSFRNTAFVEALQPLLGEGDHLDVITTMPNRYATFKVEAPEFEEIAPNIHVYRSELPEHKSGFRDQINSFRAYYSSSIKQVKGKEYDLVIASSSRLFTAFLGAKVSSEKKAPLFLDMRDLFRENMQEIIKNPVIKHPLSIFLKRIENYTFNRADRINIVSEGFSDFFELFDAPVSFYPNGIDNVFLEEKFSRNGTVRKQKIITYAGNIGDGQGLHKIIPKSAKALEEHGFLFRIIGDGGTRHLLEEELKAEDVTNVELIDPVNRDKLMDYYQDTDYLFLHLNDYEAFKKVLPSKIFEYAATGKPILAGVGGYARKFLEQHVNGVYLFEPCNVSAFSEAMKNKTLSSVELKRDEFRSKFARESIMKEMADDIMKYYRR